MKGQIEESIRSEKLELAEETVSGKVEKGLKLAEQAVSRKVKKGLGLAEQAVSWKFQKGKRSVG